MEENPIGRQVTIDLFTPFFGKSIIGPQNRGAE